MVLLIWRYIENMNKLLSFFFFFLLFFFFPPPPSPPPLFLFFNHHLQSRGWYTGFIMSVSMSVFLSPQVFHFGDLTHNLLHMGTENFTQTFPVAHGDTLLFSGHIGQRSRSRTLFENPLCALPQKPLDLRFAFALSPLFP